MKLDGKIMKTRRGHLYVQLCFPEVVEQMTLDFKQPIGDATSLLIPTSQKASGKQNCLPEIVEQLTLDDFFHAGNDGCDVKGGDGK